MILTISSPDKLSISMFLAFLRKNISGDHIIGELHYLMEKTALDLYTDSLLSKYPKKTLFTYYVKRKPNVDPERIIPVKLMEVSDAVLWFDLYETTYKLLKDRIEFDKLFLDTWKKNLTQLGS